MVKSPLANAGDARVMSSISGSERSSGVGNGNPLQYSCHEQRSPAGYSPWGHKELDTTERMHTHTGTE